VRSRVVGFVERFVKTLIVVAHKGGARLVEEHSDELRVVSTINHAASDSTPRAPDSHGRRAPAARESVREHAANVFASELADDLRKRRVAHSYSELVLIAAPRFLGTLRAALDAPTSALIRGTLDKDFGRLNDRELLKRLERL
jgi:protein required for attachment to host cells